LCSETGAIGPPEVGHRQPFASSRFIAEPATIPLRFRATRSVLPTMWVIVHEQKLNAAIVRSELGVVAN
jgi:hypothetical protein